MRKSRIKRITISIRIDDADTLCGFLDGGIGTSECEDFNKFATRVLKQLDLKIKRHRKTIN